ncbi:MAG: hypothetical protein RIQ89_407 [Bacteroidota bacterium]|jgi:predicted nucleic acid-binding Zn ribbon protein
MTEEKKCLECNEVILGRSDKKFCSDMCRNAFNNKLNSDSTATIRNINNILRKNRRILAELVPDETAKVSKNKLLDMGFNFNYHTHSYITKKGTQYIYCYEYGYLSIEHDYYFLINKTVQRTA